MKKNLTIVVCLLCLVSPLFGQSLAKDWTRTDCEGNQHHLFADCDSGKIVIIELVMMNCYPCVEAANALKTIAQDINTTHPGKVKMYSMSYNNTTDCVKLLSWRAGNNYTWPIFANGKDVADYYGGFGMPSIIVIGSDRSVLYNGLGFQLSDTTVIHTSIMSAITSSAVSEQKTSRGELSLYPNPANTTLRLDGKADGYFSHIEIHNSVGVLALRGNDLRTGMNIDVSSLSNGVYRLTAFSSKGTVITENFIIAR